MNHQPHTVRLKQETVGVLTLQVLRPRYVQIRDKITVGISSWREPARSPRQLEVNSFTLAKFTPSKKKELQQLLSIYNVSLNSNVYG